MGRTLHLEKIAAKLPAITTKPYQTKIGDYLLYLIANGMSSRAACKEVGIDGAALSGWAAKDENFSLRLARARKEGTYMMADELLDIADTETDVAFARNKIQARQWLVSKYNREQFGDKVEVQHKHNHEHYLDQLTMPEPIVIVEENKKAITAE